MAHKLADSRAGDGVATAQEWHDQRVSEARVFIFESDGELMETIMCRFSNGLNSQADARLGIYVIKVPRGLV